MTVKPYNTGQTKKEEVREMFDNIAPKYDLLNHTLSMNIDRIWRRRVVRIVRRSRPHRILDVATGTGDLAIEMARRIRDVHVLGVDLSEKMLDVARCKVAARGLDERVVLDVGDAEHLRVSDASVDVVTVAFGVRNFGDLEAGLREMARTIKPGGKVVILEFSRPRNRLFRVLYEFYTYKILPRIGGMVSKDKRAYEYLPASVGEFPAPAEFMSMMERARLPGPEPEFRDRADIYRPAMRKWLYCILLTAMVLPMVSCRRAVEKARRNIRLEAVEKVERKGMGGAEAVVRVKNGTGYKLVLERAKVDLFYAGSRVMSIILHGRVEVPRRTTGSFTSLWRVRTTDPMAYYVMVKKIREDDISQVAVSFAVEGRGGPASVKNSEEMVPLSEFLNIFGLSLQDVKNYLDE